VSSRRTRVASVVALVAIAAALTACDAKAPKLSYDHTTCADSKATEMVVHASNLKGKGYTWKVNGRPGRTGGSDQLVVDGNGKVTDGKADISIACTSLKNGGRYRLTVESGGGSTSESFDVGK
jgi:hypothetical protein